jgi:outer membrane protein OmpA-like peptidoglycan-associated protein
MKKYTWFAALVLFAVACGDSARLQYARRLMNEKAYADAVEVAKSANENDAVRNALLGESYFKLLRMEEAVDAFGNIPISDMTDEQKRMYCEALKQTGQNDRSASVAATSSNALWAKDYLTVIASKADIQIKVEPVEFNTPANEQTPFFFKDKLYYVSDAQTGFSIREKFRWTLSGFDQIVATEAGKNDLADLNTRYHDGPVAVNDAGGIVVYNRSIPSKNKKQPARLSLFQSKQSILDGKLARELSFCPGSVSFAHPAWNTSGVLLAFASTSPEGKGGMDVFTVIRQADGYYGTPVPATVINSAYEEVFPTFLTDSLMVFASSRPSGLGGLDLYSTSLQKDGTWSAPYALPAPINSTRDDFYLITESAGSRTYLFTSNRDGNDDIFRATVDKNAVGQWEIELMDEATKKPIAATKVQLKYEQPDVAATDTTSTSEGLVMANAKGGTVNIAPKGYMAAEASYTTGAHSVFSINRQKVNVRSVSIVDVNGKITDGTSGEGLPNALVVITTTSGVDTLTTDAAGNFTYTMSVKDSPKLDVEVLRQGYLPKKISGIPIQAQSTQVDINALVDLSINKVNVGDDLANLLDLEPIYFETARSNITVQGAIELDKLALFLIQNPQLVVECGSHTDCRGSAASNQQLSDQRAKSTADFLVSKGIEKSRIRYKGYGESKPVSECDCEVRPCSEEEMALNRRTEFRVLESKDGTVVAVSKQRSRAVAKGVQTPSIITDSNFAVDNDVRYFDGYRIPSNVALPAGTLYSVQIGAFAELADETYFNGIKGIRKERWGELTRYVTGTFGTYRDAEAAQAALRKVGIPDAFLVAYRNGSRIPLQDAQRELGE